MLTSFIKCLEHVTLDLRNLSLSPHSLIPLFLLVLLVTSVMAGESVHHVDTVGSAVSATAEEETPVSKTQLWHYGAYLDVGYTVDANHPDNGLWRSKSTTFKVDEIKLNMAMGYIRKETAPHSRWGLDFGLQDGVDTEGLIPGPPPAANEPVKNADQYRHLAGANLSYLLPMGQGLGITGGLFEGYPGYESYHALDNPNYTRGYITDMVPYFLVGAKVDYPVKNNLDLNFFAVTGFNYLANSNDIPSFGLQLEWQPTDEITFTQNLYYGSDQENTNLEFWRFFSDSILEWKREPFLVAVAFDVGTEKQADQPGTPHDNWMAGALWLGWHVGGPWHLAVRPEFYWDRNGLITGAEQFVQAYTATLKYQFTPFGLGNMAANLEYRYDRSTGDEGGFYNGPDNDLVPDQHLLIFALTWALGT